MPLFALVGAAFYPAIPTVGMRQRLKVWTHHMTGEDFTSRDIESSKNLEDFPCALLFAWKRPEGLYTTTFSSGGLIRTCAESYG